MSGFEGKGKDLKKSMLWKGILQQETEASLYYTPCSPYLTLLYSSEQ
jgi:hypothetical protein